MNSGYGYVVFGVGAGQSRRALGIRRFEMSWRGQPVIGSSAENQEEPIGGFKCFANSQKNSEENTLESYTVHYSGNTII